MDRTKAFGLAGQYHPRVVARLLPLVAILVSLTACGSNPITAPPTPTNNSQTPTISELTDILMAELDHLGKDVNKTVATAPSGQGNAVFDLSARIMGDAGTSSVGSREASSRVGRFPVGETPASPVNWVAAASLPPDSGEAGLAPTNQGGTGGPPVSKKQTSATTGIELSWTERIIGDYDQNGEVNLADLAPLAINFSANVNYDDPALHGGFTAWPVGDPDGADALNWRMARVDGDSKGEIGMSDITPIAVHFQERIDGYRVYRKAPGETVFTMLPAPIPVAENVTLAHPASPGNTPVRYSLSDSEATPGGLGDGVYQYYVASFDKTSGNESPASGIVHVDIVAGTVNQSPVAQLSITPGFAGAPAEITLDASGSYDPDGTVAAYEWDFDADGVVDWLSTDPVPLESSNGTVDNITEVSPGVVTVRYFEGSADWYFPSVTALDDEALESFPVTEQLGISGWHSTVLNESEENYRVRFEPQLISVDPGNGDVVIVSSRGDSDFPETTAWGINFARETPEGPWPVETIEVPEVEHQDDWPSYSVIIRDIAWDEQGQPIIMFNRKKKYPAANALGSVWYAQRQPDGTWQVGMLQDTTHPDGDSTLSSLLFYVQKNDGTIIALTSERLTDKSNLYGSPWHTKYHVVTYSTGTWTVHETVADNAETYSFPLNVVVLPNDNVYFPVSTPLEQRNEIWWSRWDSEGGLFEPERIDDGSLTITGSVRYIVALDDGTVHILYQFSGNELDWGLATISGSGTSMTIFEETDSDYLQQSLRPQFLETDGNNPSYFLRHGGASNPLKMDYVEYIIDGNFGSSTERIMSNPMFHSVDVSLLDVEFLNNQMPSALIRNRNPSGDTAYVYRVGWRVDPTK